METQSKCCLFHTKSAGKVSFGFQLLSIIITFLISLFFFHKIGGFESFAATNTTTLFDKVEAANYLNDLTSYEVDSTTWPDNVRYEEGEGEGEGEEEDFTAEPTPDYSFDIASQLINRTLVIEGMVELDVVELIRLSTLVYAAMCIAWFISLFFLLLSIKYESVEFLVVNAFMLTIACLYLFVHILFIIVLVYFQFKSDLSLISIAIVFGTAVALLLCIGMGGYALALIVGWYRYIIYMNNGERCVCISAIARIFKKSQKPESRTQEYAMPEVTQPALYRDDRFDRDFDAF